MPASLISIKLRGVRSYSPLESKAQIIEFMPLTLIVGSNGSGKTTIIESLRFIISGEEPPLSDSRRNFLHTTKDHNLMSDSKKTAYASIQLRFLNSREEICLAKRDISLGTRTSTPSVSSSYKVEGGTWNNVHKQDDWNKTIPVLFNLPNQAILNNVVLCHQEHNLWCMSDSSTVKQIFDRIFGCEQYKKEIKHIEAEIKACKGELAISTKDVSHCKEKVERKQIIRDEFENLNREIARIKSETELLDFEIEKAVSVKGKLSANITNHEKQLRGLESLKQKLLELSQREQSIKRTLKVPMIDPKLVSNTELAQLLQNHTLLVDETKMKQAEIKKQQDDLKSNLKNLESQKSSLQDTIMKLKVLELKSNETHKSLMKSLEDMKNTHLLDDIDPSDIETSLKVMSNFETKLKQIKSEQAQLEDDLSGKEYKLSRSICQFDGMHQGLNHELSSKEVLIKKLNDQLAEADPIAKDLILVTENFAKMTTITDKLTRSELVESLVKLIEQSSCLVEGIVVKIKKEGIARITEEIKKEKLGIETTKTEIDSTYEKRRDCSLKREQIQEEYSKVKILSKEAHNKLVVFSNARQNVITIFENLSREKQQLNSKNLNEKINEIDHVTQKIEETNKKLNNISLDHAKLSDELTSSFARHEEYKSNIHIRELIEQQRLIGDEIASTEFDMEDAEQLQRYQVELKEVEEKELKLRDKRSMLSGSRLQMNRELERIQSELRNYSKANMNYAESLGKVVCNNIIISDLEKLKECFQKSILTFHNQMIVKINEVLRMRWRQIYQGSDIDFIELVDEEITKGKDKKTFNYYIAMRKGGIAMKMREKSSAGQKALASIILRMTLAELFVKDFAFIALDEPTANLDFANVQSLAKAIGAYVKKRTKKGINIQWIIITHDESFLKALDAECSPYYYKLQLTSQGCSEITKISYQELKSSSVTLSSTESTQQM